MKKVVCGCVLAALVSGCAFPVISTELSGPKYRYDHRTGTNLPPREDSDRNTKYGSREDHERWTQTQGIKGN